MQKHTHTTFLLLLKKINEHEVLVICARSKKKKIEDLKKTQGNAGKFKATQGSFWSLREDFWLKEWQPCHHQIFLLLKNTFKVVLQYLFNVAIPLDTVFYLILIFKLKIDSKTWNFKNLEKICQKHLATMNNNDCAKVNQWHLSCLQSNVYSDWCFSLFYIIFSLLILNVYQC